MPIDAVIFDMDGTLLDSTRAVPAAYLETFAARGRTDLTTQDVYDRYILGPPINIVRDVLGEEDDHAAVATYHRHLGAAAADVPVYDGVEALLDELVTRHVPIALFTGADTESARLLLEATGLATRFEEQLVLGSDRVDRPKPAPDGLLLALERLDVPADRCCYVGDSPVDQQAARAAGCMAVTAAWGHLADPDEPTDLVADAPADVLGLLAPR